MFYHSVQKLQSILYKSEKKYTFINKLLYNLDIFYIFARNFCFLLQQITTILLFIVSIYLTNLNVYEKTFILFGKCSSYATRAYVFHGSDRLFYGRF